MYAVETPVAISEVNIPEEIVVKRKKGDKVLTVDDYLCGLELLHEDEIDDVRADASGDDEGQKLEAGTVPEAEGSSSWLIFELEAKPTGSLRPDILVQEILPADVRPISVTRILQSSDPVDPTTFRQLFRQVLNDAKN